MDFYDVRDLDYELDLLDVLDLIDVFGQFDVLDLLDVLCLIHVLDLDVVSLVDVRGDTDVPDLLGVRVAAGLSHTPAPSMPSPPTSPPRVNPGNFCTHPGVGRRSNPRKAVCKNCLDQRASWMRSIHLAYWTCLM